MPFNRSAPDVADIICDLTADPAETFAAELAAKAVDVGVTRPAVADVERLRHDLDTAAIDTLCAALKATAVPWWRPLARRAAVTEAVQRAHAAVAARAAWTTAVCIRREHDKRAAHTAAHSPRGVTATGSWPAVATAAPTPTNAARAALVLPALMAYAQQIFSAAADQCVSTAAAREEIINGLLVALCHRIADDGGDTACTLVQAYQVFDEETYEQLSDALRTADAPSARIRAVLNDLPDVINAVHSEYDVSTRPGRLAGRAEDLRRLLLDIVTR